MKSGTLHKLLSSLKIERQRISDYFSKINEDELSGLDALANITERDNPYELGLAEVKQIDYTRFRTLESKFFYKILLTVFFSKYINPSVFKETSIKINRVLNKSNLNKIQEFNRFLWSNNMKSDFINMYSNLYSQLVVEQMWISGKYSNKVFWVYFAFIFLLYFLSGFLHSGYVYILIRFAIVVVLILKNKTLIPKFIRQSFALFLHLTFLTASLFFRRT